MSEIRNNEVEQNKSPEPSPRTVSEGDSAKLKPPDGNEGSIDNGKEKDSSGKDSSKGEHPKLSPENGGDSHGKGEKPETIKHDNSHGKLSAGESDAEREKQPVTDDPNVKKTGDRNAEKEKQPLTDDPNAKKTGDGNAEKEKQPLTDGPNAKKTGDGNAEKEKQPLTDDTNAKKTGDGNAEKEKQPLTDDPNAEKTGDGAVEKGKQPLTDDTNAKKTGDGNAEKEKQPVTDDTNAKKTGDGNAEKEKQPVTDGPNAKKTDGVTPTPETDTQTDGVSKTDGVKKNGVTPTFETDGQADGANKTNGIKKDGVTSASDAEMKEAVPKKEGFFDRISQFFNHSKDSAEKPTQPEAEKRGSWDGMETAPAPNGSGWTLLPGNHFDKYSDIDRNYSDHPRTAYPKEQQEFRTVNPADIEGVYLGDSDIEDPSRFWGMHNGSRDAWMDTASHIPEVQARLESGEPLESLLQDEQLGKCAQAYFNPDSSKAIQVDEMAGGGYMFNGDGRHRIIAARANGYDIPVRVVGIRQ